MAQINMKQAAGFLFAGAIVGSTIALLYAPQSGARTAKKIKKLARKTAERLDGLQEDICDQVSNWANDMAEVVKDAVDRGKKLGAEGYEHVLQGFDNARNASKGADWRKLIKTA